ncbi:protein SET DOMAIN GROUP 41 isoform X2 [Phoenix dactylifera]|uniref:Protein SET DOMAIN GROUP 41 isoform X2 n=1 Tax=Phoenix dactylifera TaxID=42345 RepID=A0A8B9AQX0_PHODC|nr:protein SET DOMAIN GROUP 41 isoform X2 [Phoenix dactylifera]
MEMRAREETGLAQDLTPYIPPIAAALHDSFLPSHCTSCFRPFQQQNCSATPLSCPACDAAVRYCSLACSAADSIPHASSGECLLLSLRPLNSGPTSDLRAALRLLYSLDALGLLTPPRRGESPRRIGGLLAGDLENVLEEGGEVAERIREGGSLISRARNRKRARDERRDGAVAVVEEEALLAVLTNAVEVQVSERGALGIAVYGPPFSWFNHSCAPNACYRFELADLSKGTGSCEPGSFRVSPAGTEDASAMWKALNYGEGGASHGLCRYGPRVIVRSIKPITEGEEVCITYTDLLQPKAMRHLDLWSKYQFVCCCERCSASQEMYIDRLLNCYARDLDLDNSDSRDAGCEELADMLDQAISEYTSDDDPESCCHKLESMLSGSYENKRFQADNPSESKFRLHPCHHLSLNAYIILASAYRTCANSLLTTGLGENNNLEFFKMVRAAAAYSLLLAGATHHLFLSEPSLIATTTHYLISAGESILSIVQSPPWGSTGPIYKSEICWAVHHSPNTSKEGSALLGDKFKAAPVRFLGCTSSILLHSWPFLAQGFCYLESIRSPIDFSWLDLDMVRSQTFAVGRDTTNFAKPECSECKYQAEMSIEKERKGLFQLAVHCLIYGSYLASICFGPRNYLTDHVKELLHGSSGCACVDIFLGPQSNECMCFAVSSVNENLLVHAGGLNSH